MSQVVVDTDVASLYFKNRGPVGLRAELDRSLVCLTYVSVGELARWTEKRNWGLRARSVLTSWISHRPVLPYSKQVAYTWGWLSVESDRRGRTRPVNDTWIAACCIEAGLPLVTRNVKDFIDFAEYDGLELIAA